MTLKLLSLAQTYLAAHTNDEIAEACKPLANCGAGNVEKWRTGAQTITVKALQALIDKWGLPEEPLSPEAAAFAAALATAPDERAKLDLIDVNVVKATRCTSHGTSPFTPDGSPTASQCPGAWGRVSLARSPACSTPPRCG